MNLFYFTLITCSTTNLSSLSEHYTKLTIEFKGIDVFHKYCQNYQEAAKNQIEKNNTEILEINEKICNIINLIKINKSLNEIIETKALIDNMDNQLSDFAQEMFVSYMEAIENEDENSTDLKTKQYNILLARKKEEVYKLNILNQNYQELLNKHSKEYRTHLESKIKLNKNNLFEHKNIDLCEKIISGIMEVRTMLSSIKRKLSTAKENPLMLENLHFLLEQCEYEISKVKINTNTLVQKYKNEIIDS